MDGPTSTRPEARRLWEQRVLYPEAYFWFIVLSTLDLLLTSLILHLGGRELNPIAHAVLVQWDLTGLTIFKFMMVGLVLCLCEAIGRLRWSTGRAVAWVGVGITCVPVVAASSQLIVAAVMW